MNILILTGKFGMGHWSASQSLRQQLLHNFPDARVEVEDFLTYAVPNFAEAMYKSFNMVVTYGSHLFNAYYKMTAMGHPDARPPFEGMLLDKLADLLYQYQPDAVIATHPLCAQLVSRLKEQARAKGAHGLDLPLITCVTDVSSHPEWINQNTDCYLVASREVRQELVKKGVEASLICVTGIPVREEFRRLDCCRMTEEDTAGEEQNRFVSCGEPESEKRGDESGADCIETEREKQDEGTAAECGEPESMKQGDGHAMNSARLESAKPGENFVMGSVSAEGGRVTGSSSISRYGVNGQNAGDCLSWTSYDRKGAVANQYMLSGSSGKISAQISEQMKGLSLFCTAGSTDGSIAASMENRKGKKREVLIMGGGLGLLPKSEDFYDSLNRLPDAHITIITGNNVKLRKRLEEWKNLEIEKGRDGNEGQKESRGSNRCKHQNRHKRQNRRWENIEVVGYTNQVWEYMSRADLIVTKPGGITLFETIFAQVPILTWPPALQQEKGNASWLTEEGIGWVARKKNCVEEIREILMDEERLARARHRMGQLKKQMQAESLNGLMEVIANSQGAAV